MVEPLVNNPNPDTNQNDEISADITSSADGDHIDADVAQNFSFNGAETSSNGRHFMQETQPVPSTPGSMGTSHQQSPSHQQTAGAAGADTRGDVPVHESASPPIGEGRMQESEPVLSPSHSTGAPTREPASGSSAANNSEDNSQEPESSTEAFAVPEEIVTAPAGPVTRAQRGIRKRKEYTDGTVRYGFLTETGEPVNLQEAVSNKN